MQGLTADSMASTASSGTARRRRAGGGDPRRPAVKTAARRLSRASRGAWLNGGVEDDVVELMGSKRGRGGGGGRGNGVRRRRWCLGGRAEENQRRRESEGEGERCGASWRHPGRLERRGGEAGGGGETWPRPAVARPRSSSYWQELEEAPGSWVGPPAGWASLLGHWARPGRTVR